MYIYIIVNVHFVHVQTHGHDRSNWAERRMYLSSTHVLISSVSRRSDQRKAEELVGYASPTAATSSRVHLGAILSLWNTFPLRSRAYTRLSCCSATVSGADGGKSEVGTIPITKYRVWPGQHHPKPGVGTNKAMRRGCDKPAPVTSVTPSPHSPQASRTRASSPKAGHVRPHPTCLHLLHQVGFILRFCFGTRKT